MVPASSNDAPWLGPIRRARSDIDHAVARLADPLTRLQERLWWFCQAPPEGDVPTQPDSADILALHDAALVHLYRGLITSAAFNDLAAWEHVVAQFRTLAAADDYLQWLLEVESSGGFDKCASADEVAEAQTQLLRRLSTAVVGSVNDALVDGDYEAAAQAVYLVSGNAPATQGASAKPRGERSADPTAADELLDRMEDDLSGQCRELVQRIEKAWSTRLVSNLRPACNHASSRFGTHIQPLIDQVLSLTADADRKDRIRSLGVNLLLMIADAYEAIENWLASERTLTSALALAGDSTMKYTVADHLEKAMRAAKRQRAGAPPGQRDNAPAFKVKDGGPTIEPSWLSSVPAPVWLALAMGLFVILRIGCSAKTGGGNDAAPSAPRYDSTHPPPWVK